MTLKEFLKLHHPDILSQYNGFVSKKLPEIGTRVKSLEWGFGGGPGQILLVKGYGYKGEKSSEKATWGSNYIILKKGREEFLADMDKWWEQVVPVSQ